MILTVLKSERLKLKRSPIWIPFFILPLIGAVMGTFNYSQNLELLTAQWDSLWTQHTLFSSFFFIPALIALLAAYEWRLEHMQHNWNTYMTMPVSLWFQVWGKLIVLVLIIFLTQCLTGVLFILSGKLAGLPGLPDLASLFRNLLLGTFAGICIGSVQLYISMIIRSFALPVGIALLCSIMGLMLTSQGKGLFWPYALLSMGMNANGRDILNSGNILPFCLICIFFTVLPIALSVRRRKSHDIQT